MKNTPPCRRRDEGPKDKCGIFGISEHPNAADLSYLGLYSLQHRGQESAGIAIHNGKNIIDHRGMGLVSEVFSRRVLDKLRGNTAIGHVRYSTTGSSELKNAQPFVFEFAGGRIAIAHNGNLTNACQIKKSLEEYGSIFQTTADTEVIIHLIARSRKHDIVERLQEALGQVQGAYSLTLLYNDRLIAVKDPHGFRPLCLGKLGGTWIVASESCSLDLIGAHYERELENGEIISVRGGKLESFKMPAAERPAHCIFEFIYFARPDSHIFGQSVYRVRKNLGAELAKEAPAEADIVTPIPDSGTYAALGYAQQSGVPFDIGLTRNHYVGRTFISPSQDLRDLGVKIKLNPIREVITGKRVVVIEDSIVRGTTSRARIKTLREVGAKEIHMRVSCPPHRFPCPYGIDFPTRGELIASSKTQEEIRQYLGLDSLSYLSYEGMLRAMTLPAENFCTSCFSGNYPLKYDSQTYEQFVRKDGGCGR